jgi:hypothetical protein
MNAVQRGFVGRYENSTVEDKKELHWEQLHNSVQFY